MKYLATVSALSLALLPALANAGGEVGPVITKQEEPVAAAPVIPGGVGGAPVEMAGGIPLGAIAAGVGGLALAGLIIALANDDNDNGTSTQTTSGTN